MEMKGEIVGEQIFGWPLHGVEEDRYDTRPVHGSCGSGRQEREGLAYTRW